jgi:hypothetical protein
MVDDPKSTAAVLFGPLERDLMVLLLQVYLVFLTPAHLYKFTGCIRQLGRHPAISSEVLGMVAMKPW